LKQKNTTLNVKKNKDKIWVYKDTGKVTKKQHQYHGPENYKRPRPLNDRIMNLFCFLTNSNPTIGKGISQDAMFYILGEDEETKKWAKFLFCFLDYYRFEGFIRRVVYVEKLDEPNKWFFYEKGESKIITTNELFKELNECYYDDSDYTEEEWNKLSGKELFSHLRYYGNDIDGWYVDHNEKIAWAFEAKETIEGHKKENKWHFERTENVLNSIGIPYIRLTNDMVFASEK
jgi:hypothetical protein